MKKMIVYLAAVALFVGGITRESFLWRLFLDQPFVHNIEEGEYLSKLSVKYYGTPDYWKELALINRAPDPNLVYPEENILIPDIESIRQLHEAKSITNVNELVHKIERSMSNNRTAKMERPAVETESPMKPEADQGSSDSVHSQDISAAFNDLEESAEESSSSWPLILLILAGLLVVGFVAYYLVRRRQTTDERPGRSEPDDSLELTLSDFDDERDYSRSKRTKKEEEALID